VGAEEREVKGWADEMQYGGSPVKVGDEEYALFRDYELLAKINE
jgi:co-chaperonin GroES (HSP10)